MIIISLLFSYFLDPVGAECTLDVSLCADENAACVSSGLRNNKCLCNDGFTANDDNICQNNDSECVKETII